MSSKKKTPIHQEDLTPDEKVKYEIAEELGLLDRVMQDGWKSLTSKETGRIGGLITKKKRENEKNDNRTDAGRKFRLKRRTFIAKPLSRQYDA